MTRPVIIIGAGGHARVVLDSLRVTSIRVLGLTDDDKALWGTSIGHVPVLGSDEVLSAYSPGDVLLANGIGGASCLNTRHSIFVRYKARGYDFATIVHVASCIAEGVVLGEGVQVMAGAVVQPCTSIETNTIINTGASIDHDCSVGAHSHVGPGAVVCGGVTLGQSTLIGAGATIIPGVSIGDHCLVAAGSTVIDSIAAHARVSGTPAREMSRA